MTLKLIMGYLVVELELMEQNFKKHIGHANQGVILLRVEERIENSGTVVALFKTVRKHFNWRGLGRDYGRFSGILFF